MLGHIVNVHKWTMEESSNACLFLILFLSKGNLYRLPLLQTKLFLNSNKLHQLPILILETRSTAATTTTILGLDAVVHKSSCHH